MSYLTPAAVTMKVRSPLHSFTFLPPLASLIGGDVLEGPSSSNPLSDDLKEKTPRTFLQGSGDNKEDAGAAPPHWPNTGDLSIGTNGLQVRLLVMSDPSTEKILDNCMNGNPLM